jgi:hypothetical protein
VLSGQQLDAAISGRAPVSFGDRAVLPGQSDAVISSRAELGLSGCGKQSNTQSHSESTLCFPASSQTQLSRNELQEAVHSESALCFPISNRTPSSRAAQSWASRLSAAVPFGDRAVLLGQQQSDAPRIAWPLGLREAVPRQSCLPTKRSG